MNQESIETNFYHLARMSAFAEVFVVCNFREYVISMTTQPLQLATVIAALSVAEIPKKLRGNLWLNIHLPRSMHQSNAIAFAIN